MSMRSEVVTGASGWLGARLVRALTQGLPDVPSLKEKNESRLVRCLVRSGTDRSTLKTIAGKIELIEGDLTNPGSLDGLFNGLDGAAVFHCAGVIHPRKRAREFFAVNVEGTRNILEAAIKARASRFIHVSSISPMGFNSSRGRPFDESSPYDPHGNYGKSKKLAEEIVNSAGGSGKIEVVIARGPWFYGPGQPSRQTRFFTMIRDGVVPVTGSGENLRSMVYVDNLCQGLLLCEKAPEARGRTYWFADSKPYTMNQIINTIERVMEKDFSIPVAHRRKRLPAIAGEIALALDDVIQGLGFYQPELHVLSEMNKNIVCSIAQAEKELGYRPAVALEEGMRRSIKWLLDKGIKI